jgi:hypothetical protein
VVKFTPPPLYPQGKKPWHPLDRRLGGPQSRSGRGGEEKNSQPLPGLEPLIIQPAAQRWPYFNRSVNSNRYIKLKTETLKIPLSLIQYIYIKHKFHFI